MSDEATAAAFVPRRQGILGHPPATSTHSDNLISHTFSTFHELICQYHIVRARGDGRSSKCDEILTLASAQPNGAHPQIFTITKQSISSVDTADRA